MDYNIYNTFLLMRVDDKVFLIHVPGVICLNDLCLVIIIIMGLMKCNEVAPLNGFYSLQP